MSLVDVGRSLHRRAVDLFCGRPILFIHVPKCGGTSIGRALRSAYILSQGTVKPHESAKAFDTARPHNPRLNDVFELREMMLLYLLYCDTRCVAAHVPFSEAAFENFGAKYAFVTMLREPVERFVSNYYWSRRPGGPGTAPETLEKFLDSESAEHAGSTYVRFFCGDPGRDKFTPRHVERAVANLRRIHHVGFLDEVAEFERALRHLTGRRTTIGRENVGKRSGRGSSDLPEAVREKLLAACAPDREIWDAVQDLRAQPAADGSARVGVSVERQVPRRVATN